MSANHKAAVDRLVEDRANLLDQMAFMQGTLHSAAEALWIGGKEIAIGCSLLCPSLPLIHLTHEVVTHLALMAVPGEAPGLSPSWVDLVADAVGDVDDGV